MPTESQILANQANAQKSTGPTSTAGKAASSKNRLQHGLSNGYFNVLADESFDSFQRLLEALEEEHQPATVTESLLVEQLAQSQWLRERAQRLVDSCFDSETGQLANEKRFSLYLRYQTMHDRAFHKCLATLLKLRSDKQKVEIGFEREKREQDLHSYKKQRAEMEITMLQIRELNHNMSQREAAMRQEEEKQAAELGQAA